MIRWLVLAAAIVALIATGREEAAVVVGLLGLIVMGMPLIAASLRREE